MRVNYKSPAIPVFCSITDTKNSADRRQGSGRLYLCVRGGAAPCSRRFPAGVSLCGSAWSSPSASVKTAYGSHRTSARAVKSRLRRTLPAAAAARRSELTVTGRHRQNSDVRAIGRLHRRDAQLWNNQSARRCTALRRESAAIPHAQNRSSRP